LKSVAKRERRESMSDPYAVLANTGGVAPGDGRRQFTKHILDALRTFLTSLQLDDDLNAIVLLEILPLLRNFPGDIPDTPNEFTTKLVWSTWEVLQSEAANLKQTLEFSTATSKSAAEVCNTFDFGTALTKRWSKDNLLPAHQPSITPRPQQVYIYIFIYITMLSIELSFFYTFLYFWPCCDNMFNSLLYVVGPKSRSSCRRSCRRCCRCCCACLHCKFSVLNYREVESSITLFSLVFP
jgi:hypothetical protein